MKYLHLNGTPFQRGHIHGTQCQTEIHAMLQRWDRTLRADLGMDLNAYVSRYLADTQYVDASRDFAPAIMEEVEGIAAGAEIPFETAFVIQAGLDEHWHHRETLSPKVPATLERCSGFGVVQNGQSTILAQNQDLPAYLDGAQIMLEVEDEDHGVRILMPSIAGFIGLHGMNDRGVSNCVNTLAQLSCNTTGPLSTFVIRAMLNCHTFDAAVALVKSAGHTVGLNYIIADANQLIDLETSANQVAEYRPHLERVYHTNHPLVNDDFADVPDSATDEGNPQLDEFNTNERMSVLQRELDNGAPVDVAKAKLILSCPDGHVCRAQENPIPAFTFTSAIMELGSAPVIHVSAGPPNRVAYETFCF